MEAAARHLTPVTLELGGKSPAVIDKSCDLQKTARMIAWAKTLNCGQICVSVDYALCPQSMLMELIEYIKSAWNEFYGEDIQYSSDYSRIVNTTHFDRLVDLLNNTRGQIVYDDCLMKEEIFGPILPIMPYESLEQACHWIVNAPVLEQPLVLYIFSNDSLVDEQVMERVASGGVSINEVISHVMSSWLPFGGIGKSGIGVYHGKYSVQVFSHARAILKRNFRMEPLVGIRYPPTTGRKNWLLGLVDSEHYDRLDMKDNLQWLKSLHLPSCYRDGSRVILESFLPAKDVLYGSTRLKLALFSRLSPIPYFIHNCLTALSLISFRYHMIATVLGIISLSISSNSVGF
ncbi:Fatty aldehyde dehydrogenase [Galdieria sulphuraria]|nr:Fatty aldehyde dehydrogenase [Galdieria sulphuraria]